MVVEERKRAVNRCEPDRFAALGQATVDLLRGGVVWLRRKRLQDGKALTGRAKPMPLKLESLVALRLHRHSHRVPI